MLSTNSGWGTKKVGGAHMRISVIKHWQTQTGLSAPSFSSTRWWSKFEVIAQIHDAFGDVTTFLQNDDLPSTTVTKMSEILNDPVCAENLKLSLL